MAVTENRLYKGYWWRPDTPDDKIAGVLTIEPDGRAILELFGAFRFEEEGLYLEKRSEDVVWGRCYAPNSHLKDISLINCYPAMNYNFSSLFPIVRYTCSYALIGIHSKSMDSEDFFKANVHFTELAHWSPPGTVLTTYKESGSVSVSLVQLDDTNSNLASVTLQDGTTLNLVRSASFYEDYPKISIEQSTYLEVLKDRISARAVLSKVRRFEPFLSFALLAPTERDDIFLFSKRACQVFDTNAGKQKRYYHPIELISRHNLSDRATADQTHKFLFRFNEVSDQLGTMLNKYYSSNGIIQIWSNLTDSLEPKRVFTSNDFLNIVQALDGFSIRFREEDSFLAQLKALNAEFQDIQKLKLTEDDIKAATDSRHYYSHILSLDKKSKRHVLDGPDLYQLTRRLRVLLICCLLNFLGFDNIEINSLLNHCHNSIVG